MFDPGSACPECGGSMHAYGSHISGEHRIRYYRCSECRWAPADNKWVIPVKYAPRRISMRRPSSRLGKRNQEER